MMVQMQVLMESVCSVFPQEWPELLPAVEHLLHTAPQGPHGLSAHDLSCAHAVASETDKRLVPFLIPHGLPETDLAVNMFSRFRQLYGVVQREMQEDSFNTQMKLNGTRIDRTFEPGETVFRKLPKPARPNKYLFPSPCSGPYIVEEQPTTTSLILKDPQSGKLVDGGAKIPLDQIVAGPRKARLRFEEEDDVRPYSQMVGRDSLPVTEPLRRGGTPSRTTGWGGCIKGPRWRISASRKARTRGNSVSV